MSRGPVASAVFALLGFAAASTGVLVFADVASAQIPGPATLISPAGPITTPLPTYAWNAAGGATWYWLWVDDSTGIKIQTWYTAAQAGCPSGMGICAVTPAAPVAGGGRWWIQTYSTAGYGPWSSELAFAAPPSLNAATLVAPKGTIGTAMPTYTWNAVTGATWYWLWVNDFRAGGKIQMWYSAAQAGCAGGTGTCSVTPAIALKDGTARWWVETYNTAGYGPWSAGLTFTVATQPPLGAVTLVSPTGAVVTRTPTYTWNAVFSATWYWLWVNDSTHSGLVQIWYTAAQAGCAAGTGTCSVTPAITLATGAGRWWIQTYNDTGYGPWSSPLSFVNSLEILHVFAGGITDGAESVARLVQATDGNFYGGTVNGGQGSVSWRRDTGVGIVFKMASNGTLTVLHDSSAWFGFIQATDGNFYGTTSGAVFKMSPEGTVTTMRQFVDGGTAGGTLFAPLIQAADGNFYGTTFGNTYGVFGPGNGTYNGTVFKMASDGTVTALHVFDGTDGYGPRAALLQATDGNFYGTTTKGGAFGQGTVFKLTPAGTFTVLHAFAGGADGAQPWAPLIQATDGNLYGTTDSGGLNAGGSDLGTIFKMTPDGTPTVLHTFGGGDGINPRAALLQATDGAFYGTTYGGTLFKMITDGTTTGTTVTLLRTDLDGAWAPVIQGTDGMLYGTTQRSGAYGVGEVFRYPE